VKKKTGKLPLVSQKTIAWGPSFHCVPQVAGQIAKGQTKYSAQDPALHSLLSRVSGSPVAKKNFDDNNRKDRERSSRSVKKNDKG